MTQTKPTLHTTTHPTPVGLLALGRVRSRAPRGSLAKALAAAGRDQPSPAPRSRPSNLRRTAQELDEYFAGSRTSFDLRSTS